MVKREKGEIEKGEKEKKGTHQCIINLTLDVQINSHTVMLLNLLSGLLAAVTPTVTG